MQHRTFVNPNSLKGGIQWETLRHLFFFAVLSLLWLIPNPNSISFRDDPTAGREGSPTIQALWFGLFFLGFIVNLERLRSIKRQFDITITMLVAWCFLTTYFAIVPDASIRRLAFTIITVMLMIFGVAGVKNLRTFVYVLLSMIVAETLTKYLFVAVFPSIAVHTGFGFGDDLGLVGLWKGQYAHKNNAGPVCAIELIVIYAARRYVSSLYLIPLAALEVIFLIKSGSKTPLILVFSVIILAKYLLRFRSGLTIALTVLLGLTALNVITVGSVVNDDARQIARLLVGDASFTGRVEVWKFLIEYSAREPLIGAGFQSFWQVGDLSPAVQDGTSWVNRAVYGHQGFLDTVVMIGYPGLILLLLFIVVRPALDLGRNKNRKHSLLEMFVAFWLFGLFTNGTESIFLGRADATWLFCIAGVVGIRRLAIQSEQERGAGAGQYEPAASAPSKFVYNRNSKRGRAAKFRPLA